MFKPIFLTSAMALTSLLAAQSEPQIPSSRAAQRVECSDPQDRPDWCSDVGMAPQSWRHKDWTVTIRSDEMDVEKRASVRGNLYNEYGAIAGWIEIDVWNGGRFISHGANTGSPSSPLYNLNRRNEGWPHCVGDNDRIAVDAERVQYLAIIENRAQCNLIAPNGRAITSMKRGSSAKVRLGSSGEVYTLSLSGFSAAMRRAMQQTRR